MAIDERAQVKAINNLFRTALMNKKYYAWRLRRYRFWNKTFEVVIAIGTSSVLAGWTIWKVTAGGAAMWGALAGCAAVAGVLKPIFQLPREIERYSKLHLAYCSLFYDVDNIVFEIQHSKALSPAAWKNFLQVRRRNNELGVQDDPEPIVKQLQRCQEEVLREYPKGSLWLPKHNIEQLDVKE